MRGIEAVEAESMGGSSIHLPEEEGKRLSSVWGRQRAGVVIFGSISPNIVTSSLLHLD